jgi:GntR family transcriptional regulator
MAKRQLARPAGSSSKSKHVAPLHQQLYVELRQRLIDGLEPLDHPLPSESALSERFGISRVTVRRALGRLEDEGLIRRQKGIGSFPARRAETPQRTNISGLIENLITLQENTTARNL